MGWDGSFKVTYTTANRVIRGNDSLSNFNNNTSSNTNTNNGWRPCPVYLSVMSVKNIFAAKASKNGLSFIQGICDLGTEW